MDWRIRLHWGRSKWWLCESLCPAACWPRQSSVSAEAADFLPKSDWDRAFVPPKEKKKKEKKFSLSVLLTFRVSLSIILRSKFAIVNLY